MKSTISWFKIHIEIYDEKYLRNQKLLKIFKRTENKI
jgi:hypothetical protein